MKRQYRLRSTKEPVEIISTDHMAPDQSKRFLVRIVRTDDKDRPYHHTYTTFPDGLVNGNPNMQSELDIEIKPLDVIVLVGLVGDGHLRCTALFKDGDAQLIQSEIANYKSLLGAVALNVEVTEGQHHVKLQN